MLPKSARPAADRPAQPAPRPRLRSAGGNYVIDRLPAAVPRHPDEHLGSWVIRLAHRYGLSPRELLTAIGLDMPPQRMLRFDHLAEPARAELAEQLAITPDDLLHMHGRLARALTDARVDYRREAGLEVRAPALSRTRYCPECLQSDGFWRESWMDPLHVVCVEHEIVLLESCPVCCRPPFGGFAWLTSRTDVTTCAGFETSGGDARFRRRCLTDLTAVEAPGVFDDVTMKAQSTLFELAQRSAVEPHALVRVCGVDGRAQTVLEAWLAIVDKHVHASGPANRETYERALHTGFTVITSASLRAAALNAERLEAFGPNNELAPLARDSQVRAKPRNPLIAAITLNTFRGTFSLGAELSHRLGSARPRYPDGVNPTTRVLQESDARGALPLGWIPQVVWPGSLQIETDPALGIETPLGRAFTSTCLARYGSDRPWRHIAIALGLPAVNATNFRAHWRAIYDAKLWPTYLVELDALYHRIHERPPTIDYQDRRLELADATALEVACRRTRRILPEAASDLSTSAIARRFWSDYTGGHGSFAPSPFHGDAMPPPLPAALRDAIALNLNLGAAATPHWHPP